VYLLFILLAFACIAALVFKMQRKRGFLDWADGGYKQREFLLSSTELEFFHTLRKVVGKNETIFAKVRQADILETGYRQNHPGFWHGFNRIARRHVDFLLCDLTTSKILTVIELQDSSHKRPDRSKRDHELRQALAKTSVRLIEIRARARYAEEEIRRLVFGRGHAFHKLPLIPGDKAKEPPAKPREERIESTLKKPFAPQLPAN
jgi:hypothetical protein